MAGVDLSVYRFDYDLTFVALLMNADGTIYHTYGGRDWTDPLSHLSTSSFARVLLETLIQHERRGDAPAPKREAKRTVEEFPKFRQGKKPDCFHCHMVHDGEIDALRQRRRFRTEDAWVWPDPAQAGLVLDRDGQTVVAEVRGGSGAAKAGLKPGDRIVRVGGAVVRTCGDVQRALHDAPGSATALEVAWERAGEEHSAALRLGKDWKEPTPEVFAWRPIKWNLGPRPGFGGPRLDADELKRAGLPADAFAMRVNYIVTWGDHAHTGRNAAHAGLRKGDLVLSVGGKDDFTGPEHFHAWFRLTQKEGRTIPIEVLRAGKRETLRMKVVD